MACVSNGDGPDDMDRSVADQETTAKLFFTRYLHVSSEHMICAIGVHSHKAKDPKEYTATKTRLSNIWRTIQAKTFGMSSYLAKLVQHHVEQHDYQANVYNLTRQIRFLEIDPLGERLDARTSRLAEV
jgi:hypothetical protein